jgi:hypothetical protein
MTHHHPHTNPTPKEATVNKPTYTDVQGRVWTQQDQADRAYAAERVSFRTREDYPATSGERVQLLVLAQADGYGRGITDPVLLWDTSHWRDSSPEAIRVMAAMLRAAEAGWSAAANLVTP